MAAEEVAVTMAAEQLAGVATDAAEAVVAMAAAAMERVETETRVDAVVVAASTQTVATEMMELVVVTEVLSQCSKSEG